MKYTVTSTYSATGEGSTVTLCYVMCDSPESALEWFKKHVHCGDFFVHAAEVVPGWDFTGAVSRLLITPELQTQLEDERCHQNYVGTIHFNYS